MCKRMFSLASDEVKAGGGQLFVEHGIDDWLVIFSSDNIFSGNRARRQKPSLYIAVCVRIAISQSIIVCY